MQLICFSGEHYLGYNNYDLKGVSFYNLVHPESTKEVQSKHRLSKYGFDESRRVSLSPPSPLKT
jgi:hypothetical protein